MPTGPVSQPPSSGKFRRFRSARSQLSLSPGIPWEVYGRIFVGRWLEIRWQICLEVCLEVWKFGSLEVWLEVCLEDFHELSPILRTNPTNSDNNKKEIIITE